MSKTIIPTGYKSNLDLYQTQAAIDLIKIAFVRHLKKALNLKRVSAPLFVDPVSGLNDNLTGAERPVSFDLAETGGIAEVVQSLAKWKRMALHRYGFTEGEGLYTDMNAIRRDEEMDNLHSVYVDQWDWEKVISPADRTLDYLYKTVQTIVDSICNTLDVVSAAFPRDAVVLKSAVTCLTSRELEKRYPELTPKEREIEITRQCKTVFVSQIGKPLENGKPHDLRAPDYDDWDLNGDLLFWHETLGTAVEISSMGIRVTGKSLARQLESAGCAERMKLPFHKALAASELPPAMGGGIGQSRLCMLLLGKAHIGEVQSSMWDEDTVKTCAKDGVILL